MKKFCFIAMLFLLVTTTYTVFAASTLTLNPVADTFVRSGDYSFDNYGEDKLLQTKRYETGESDGEEINIFLKFDLSKIDGEIDSAVLRMFGGLSGLKKITEIKGEDDKVTGIIEEILLTIPEKIPVAVYPVAETSWEEGKGKTDNVSITGITYQTMPELNYQYIAKTIIDDSLYFEFPNWYEWDLTKYIQEQKAAGSKYVSLMVKVEREGYSNGVVFFSTDAKKEMKEIPELVVNTK